MAHADYSCCAVCDRKMSYGEEGTKDHICTDCVVTLARRGVFLRNGAELLAWMRANAPLVVVAHLTECGFHRCYYANAVDEEMAKAMAAAAPTTGAAKSPLSPGDSPR